MKRTLQRIIPLVLTAAVMVAAFQGVTLGRAGMQTAAASKTQPKTKHLSITSMHGTLNSMELKWKKPKGVKVTYYNIYKRNVTKDLKDDDPSFTFNGYKKAAKISGNSTSYTDKKVKRGEWYSYEIRGYYKRSKKAKAKLVCTSYIEGCFSYDIVGLQPPDLLNVGYGEFYTNTTKKLYLYPQITNGPEPTGIEVYRKSESDTKFKKISVSLTDVKPFGPGSVLIDKSVTPGEVYTYKVRTTKKVNGKIYRSKFSNKVTIPAVNMHGEYSVSAVTPAGDTSTFDIKLTSKKNNGKTTFGKSLKMIYSSDGAVSPDLDYEFNVRLISYSKDGTTWCDIPDEGAVLRAGETIYLRFEFFNENGSTTGAFTGNTTGSILYWLDGGKTLQYQSSGRGWLSMTLYLGDGTGRAFVDFD